MHSLPRFLSILCILSLPLTVMAGELPKVSGQIVRIELPGENRTLALAEVGVFEKGVNLALNQQATQSTVAYSGAATRAVDGKANGDFFNDSVSHTSTEANPWWEVDLGSMANIEAIIVYNRTDSHGQRLDGFTLKVLDAKRQEVFSKKSITASDKVSFLQSGVQPSQVVEAVKSAASGKDLGAIWFIGDSITQSNADGDPQGSPRKSLYDLLKANGYSFSYTGHHARNVDGLPATGASPADNLYHYHSGVSGILIGDATRRGFRTILPTAWRQGRLATVKPDMILIMLGTNDVGHGYDLDNGPQRLRGLLDEIYALPNIGQPKVLLGTIPPNRRIEADRTNVMIFNESVPRIVLDYRAKGHAITMVDQFKAIDAAYEANMRGDNLHPNATGNDTMAKQWFDAIQAAQQSGDTGSGDEAMLFPGKKSDFRGYDRYDRIKTKSGHFSIICPKNPAPGKPWLWRSLFWEAIQQFSNTDLKLVDEGYYVVLAHGDVAGHPRGSANIDAAYALLTEEYGFAKTCSMASMSRGTLSLFRWASENPEKVNSIYVDNGVLNVLSWPAGKLVPGNDSFASGAASSWAGFKKKFGYTTDEEALKTKESPIDLLEPLAKAGVPILSVCGSKDPAVPYEENDAILEERYKALGGEITVIVEDKGHSHGMKDPTPVLEFIRKYSKPQNN
ncbi:MULTISPECIES: GDSL-type esterase/lipase family protein [unclassified Lentimonas]|uniref:GDSL-type esterase/lipase family protein n=1 Tax=unclassified Lentimonas TaxID=2630993 RepID=UPI00132ACAE1|nr:MULTISPECIES: GDSL-type esterase/lipase family protein [unclassified Lentimonas]CAA6691685.1 Unannotated [Lentimonas sp. CC19]CAA6696011.1 Unannotated [Lentimonas sp. CC10]CAA7070039.1 Unannotated [Lentimonas sp. CC11]